jgi:hypothetical protein
MISDKETRIEITLLTAVPSSASREADDTVRYLCADTKRNGVNTAGTGLLRPDGARSGSGTETAMGAGALLRDLEEPFTAVTGADVDLVVGRSSGPRSPVPRSEAFTVLDGCLGSGGEPCEGPEAFPRKKPRILFFLRKSGVGCLGGGAGCGTFADGGFDEGGNLRGTSESLDMPLSKWGFFVETVGGTCPYKGVRVESAAVACEGPGKWLCEDMCGVGGGGIVV